MKRIISVLLCLVLLCSTVGVLSSCSSRYTGEPKVSRRKVDVDISGYTIIYDRDISDSSKVGVKDFATRIKEATGESLKTMQESATGTSVDGGAIYVGLVSSALTEDALDSIDGHGWTIRVDDDQIVIVGTTQLFTNMALEYFENHYLKGSGSSVLTVNKKVLLEEVPTVDLISGGEYRYDVVYSSLLDDEEGTQHTIPGNHTHGGTSTVD